MPRYTLCPYFNHDRRNARITCEDTYRRFDSDAEKWAWMDMYCDNEWTKCPYAMELTEAYERLEKGDVKALENHEIAALKKELKSVATKLGTVEKKLERSKKRIDELTAINQSFVNKNDDLEKGKKKYFTKWREADRQLQAYEKKIDDQVKRIVEVYEQRMCYLIDTFAPGKMVCEQDIKEWAGEKEFALVADYSEDEKVYWKVVFNEKAGETDNIPDAVQETK